MFFLEAKAIRNILGFNEDGIFSELKNLNEFRNANIKDDFYIQNYLKTIELMTKNLPKKVIKGAFVTAPFTLVSILNGLSKTKKDVAIISPLCSAKNILEAFFFCVEL